MGEISRARVLCVFGYEHFFGAERANVRVLRYLVEAGHDVRCLVSTRAPRPLIDALDDAGIAREAVPFGPSFFGLSGDLRHYAGNLAGIARVSWKVFLLSHTFRPTHLYVPNYIQFLYGWPSIAVSRARVIFRVGDPPETSSLHRMMWRCVIQPFVDVFAPNSEFTRQRLVQAGVPLWKARVVRNSLTRTVGAPVKPSTPTIVYLGQINRQKGVDIAVAAALDICVRHQRLRFVFVGPLDLDPEFSASLLQRVEGAGLSDRILFPGYREDVMAHLTGALVHICPSVQQESSANVVVEAKFAGVPSVVFPNGGLPELVHHEIDGYVCRRPDRDALIEGIEYFLDHPDRLAIARERALESARSFTPAVAAEAWTALLASGHHSPP